MRFLNKPHRDRRILGGTLKIKQYPTLGDIIVCDPNDTHPHPYPMRVIEERTYDGIKGTFPMVILRQPHLDPTPYTAEDTDEDIGWTSPPTLIYLEEDYPVGANSGELLPSRHTMKQWEQEDTQREFEAFSTENTCPACLRPIKDDRAYTYDINLINPMIPTVKFHKVGLCGRIATRYQKELDEMEKEINLALDTLKLFTEEP